MLVHMHREDFASTGHSPGAPGYDVFIASPMSPFSSSDYHANRESLISLVQGLKRSCGFSRFFCPGIAVESKEAFASEYNSVAEDLAALNKSSFFILHYVNAVKSSALFEAGIAFSKGIPSVYLVKKRDDLPYLLRELERYEYSARQRSTVKVIELDAHELLADAVNRHWFDFAPTAR